MARTTNSKVREIVSGIPDTVNLQPYIEFADVLVTYACIPRGYSEVTHATLLEKITTCLAAHFWQVERPSANEEEADMVRDRFDSKVEIGLKLTRWGQQAIILDVLGGLAALDTKPKVRQSALWLGRYPRRRVRDVEQET